MYNLLSTYIQTLYKYQYTNALYSVREYISITAILLFFYKVIQIFVPKVLIANSLAVAYCSVLEENIVQI
jgi:hypothetical protein